MRTTRQQADEAAELRRAVTALAARARVERHGELTLNQVAVLGRVIVQGPVTPGEVADDLGMLPQSLTRVLAGLETLGHLTRMPDPNDGRGSLLAATPSGRQAMRLEMAPRDRWTAQAIAAVCSDADRATLAAAAEIMQRLVVFGGGVERTEP